MKVHLVPIFKFSPMLTLYRLCVSPVILRLIIIPRVVQTVELIISVAIFVATTFLLIYFIVFFKYTVCIKREGFLFFLEVRISIYLLPHGDSK